MGQPGSRRTRACQPPPRQMACQASQLAVPGPAAQALARRSFCLPSGAPRRAPQLHHASNSFSSKSLRSLAPCLHHSLPSSSPHFLLLLCFLLMSFLFIFFCLAETPCLPTQLLAALQPRDLQQATAASEPAGPPCSGARMQSQPALDQRHSPRVHQASANSWEEGWEGIK